MIKCVEEFLKNYNIINKTVIIGFSSGPDSCALGLIIDKLKKKYNLKPVIAYFNHGWRIKESKEEELFALNFAKDHGFEFITKSAPKNVQKTEEKARELRYLFFEKCAKKYKTDVVLLAHNKNDNIETLIYRIIKGTSIKGLTSIPQHRDIYYRPLLEIEKDDILEFLKSNNQEYKIDSSNNDIKYKRNLIRQKILPLFKEINPNYINNINNLIKTSINTRKIVDSEIELIQNRIIVNNSLKRSDYLNLDQEIRLEIINNFLGKYLKQRNYKNLIKFDDFIKNNTNSKTSINSTLFLKVKNNSILIEEKKQKNTLEIEINSKGKYAFENGTLIIEEELDNIKTFPKSKENCCFLNIDFPITLRHRKQGDVFSPYGLKGKIKLKDYLINEKIEQTKKDELVLVCKNKEVIWIINNKISENYKVKTKPCYKLIWRENEKR